MTRGKMIVLYGSNNLGKSAQLELLENLWQEMGRRYRRIKYPMYSLEPTGPVINAVLREGYPMGEEDFQALCAQNRRDYQPALSQLLESGIDVIVEDYKGTGMVWGLVKGVDREFLNEINKDLMEPDVAICLDGERFASSIERGHRHEAAGDGVWERSRRFHIELAREYDWEIVDAGQSMEKVHEGIKRVLVEKGVI